VATYTSPARRRARTVAVGVTCVVLGLVGGVLIGRASVTTTAERITQVRTAGDELATRVQALTIEYEQAVAGQGDTVEGGVLDALDGIRRDAATATAAAPWLSTGERADVDGSLRSVAEAATARVEADAFAARTAAAAAVIRTTFGVDP
jgi:hypothetical protein